MTNEEIVREYRQAAHPAQQIGILADLNECKKKAIVEILREAGCKLPGYYDKKPPKAPTGPQPVEGPDEAPAEDVQPDASVEVPEIEDDGYVKVTDALPFLIRTAAIDAIAQLLAKSSKKEIDDIDIAACDFQEQVRGVLALVHEVERRCDDEEEG
jgi:hypothetical protein